MERILGFTIDPDGAQDLDDGLRAVRDGPHNAIVDVPIAYTAKHIGYGSLDHLNAHRMAETDYKDEGFVYQPMIRSELTDKISVLPYSDKDAIVVRFFFEKKRHVWKMKKYSIFEGIFYSYRQLKYEDADALIHGRAFGPKGLIIKQQLKLLMELTYDLRRTYRKRRTSQELEDGFDGDSHDIIEDFMVLTNVTITRFLHERQFDFLYRNHAGLYYQFAANGELEEKLVYAYDQIDQKMSQYASVFPQRAEYSTSLKGHLGLDTPIYSHHTSPLRRLTDFINQYVLVAALRGQTSPISKNELDLFAGHINLVRLWKRGNHRHVLTDAMEKLLAKITNLSSLESKEFTRLVGMGVHHIDDTSSFMTLLQQEVERRLLSNQSFSDEAYAIILFSTNWKKLHVLALDMLDKYTRQRSFLTYIVNKHDRSLIYVFDDSRLSDQKKIVGRLDSSLIERTLRVYAKVIDDDIRACQQVLTMKLLRKYYEAVMMTSRM